jgi:hypothetical protein
LEAELTWQIGILELMGIDGFNDGIEFQEGLDTVDDYLELDAKLLALVFEHLFNPNHCTINAYINNGPGFLELNFVVTGDSANQLDLGTIAFTHDQRPNLSRIGEV